MRRMALCSGGGRHLLHAFADAGQPSATGLQLLVGPNGVLVWTEAAQVDRSQLYAGDVFTSPEKSAARVNGKSPAPIRPRSPRRTPYTRLLRLL
jgi:hypothetical protein